MKRLEGRVAVVTGGTQGVGKGIVLQLASAGAKVVSCSRSPEANTVVLTELAARGAIGSYIQADLSIRSQAEQVVHAAVDRFGQVDILVNNA